MPNTITRPRFTLAVRKGVSTWRDLINQGAESVDYRSYPFQDSLLDIAEDRENQPMADLLREVASGRFPVPRGFGVFLDAVNPGIMTRDTRRWPTVGQ